MRSTLHQLKEYRFSLDAFSSVTLIMITDSAAQKRKQCIVLDVLCGSPPPCFVPLFFKPILYFVYSLDGFKLIHLPADGQEPSRSLCEAL